ncbi:hypothetical protein ATANTOWER_026465 [Ataeniobius toweri]|uniref:Uncharacterized protein n=1 Tax=Ataeniobius toweri TaxID=208326 RepID=A0ABU7B9M0_9TELE|nr:hypothetical protein [Ataeniobius toweri]
MAHSKMKMITLCNVQITYNDLITCGVNRTSDNLGKRRGARSDLDVRRGHIIASFSPFLSCYLSHGSSNDLKNRSEKYSKPKISLVQILPNLNTKGKKLKHNLVYIYCHCSAPKTLYLTVCVALIIFFPSELKKRNVLLLPSGDL